MTANDRSRALPATESRADPRAEQAALWVAAQDRGHLTPQEQARLTAWLTADSRNFGAYVRAQALYRALDYTTIAPSDATRPPQGGQDSVMDHGRRRMLAGTVAACVVGLATRPVPPDRVILLRRDRESPRRYAWQGAAITLDALSAAYLPRFDDMNHGIRMLSGRVGVQTSRTPVRLSLGQFQFWTHNADFDLTLKGGRTMLIAYQGAVTLSDGSRQTLLQGPGLYHLRDDAPSDMPAGTTEIETRSLSPTDALSCRAWREAQTVLNNTRLADAAAQFNRYSRTRIQIGTDRIAEERVTGSFNLLQPADFARTVQKLLRCRLSESGNRIVLS